MNDFNFFADYNKKRSDSFNVKSPYFIGALVLMLCVVLSISLLVRNLILVKQMENVNSKIQTIQETPEYIKANQMRQSIDSMNQYDSSAGAVLEKFKNSSIIGTDIMNILSSELPSTATMMTFSMDNAIADFTFNVPDKKAAAELVLSLKNTELFQDVSLNSIATIPEGGGSVVSINAVMKAGEAK